MYAKEGNKEACDEGHDACCISGIEALEKDKRGDNGGTGESNVIHWVDATKEKESI